MFSGPLAAIQTVVRERSTNSIPPAFTFASLLNCLLWAGLGLALADAFVWFPNVLGLVSYAHRFSPTLPRTARRRRRAPDAPGRLNGSR